MIWRRNHRFNFKKWGSRPGALWASREERTVATYTLDQSYVTTYQMSDDVTTLKVLPRGTILAIDPDSQKVVPNFSPYNFAPLGVLLEDAECGNLNGDDFTYDQEVGVIWSGVVYEKTCWDNGTKGTVLDTTKAALVERIDFVKKTSKTKWK
jgi:hypothetical protein